MLDMSIASIVRGRVLEYERTGKALRNYEDYLDDVETLVAVIKSTGESVYLPGEVEDDRATAAGGSITLDEDVAAQLSTLGRRLGVEPPAGLTGEATRRFARETNPDDGRLALAQADRGPAGSGVWLDAGGFGRDRPGAC